MHCLQPQLGGQCPTVGLTRARDKQITHLVPPVWTQPRDDSMRQHPWLPAALCSLHHILGALQLVDSICELVAQIHKILVARFLRKHLMSQRGCVGECF